MICPSVPAGPGSRSTQKRCPLPLVTMGIQRGFHHRPCFAVGKQQVFAQVGGEFQAQNGFGGGDFRLVCARVESNVEGAGGGPVPETGDQFLHSWRASTSHQ